MIGRPSDAPAPKLAKECRRSCSRTPSRPAARQTAAQGFLRSARGAPSFAPAMTCGLPSIRGRARQDGLRRCGKVDRLPAGLAVRQEDDAALQIDLRPLRVENFAKPGARQDQQPDRGDGERVEPNAPVFGLRRVLGARLRFIDRIGQADGFAFRKRGAEAREFVAGQEALAPLLAIFLQPLCRVVALGNKPARRRPCERLSPNRYSTICRIGPIGHASVKRCDMRPRERFRFQSAMGAAQLGKGNAMAYRRSRLHHRPDVLLVEKVEQLTDGDAPCVPRRVRPPDRRRAALARAGSAAMRRA